MKGACQGGIGDNSNAFLQRWTRGASTLDLVVVECGQMDLASAYVLPLDRLVLNFAVWNGGWVNEGRSGGILDWRCRRGLESRGGVKNVKLIGDEVADGLGLRRLT